jgi:hypothetical protein
MHRSYKSINTLHQTPWEISAHSIQLLPEVIQRLGIRMLGNDKLGERFVADSEMIL